MAWSNAAERMKFTVEKSHSLSFSVRVEDRLHTNIIQGTDTCWFTVRPVNYLVGFNDTDITVGTASVKGNGIRVDGTRVGVGEKMRFQFEVQAAMLNLDPELEYWYDITYTRDNYSLSVAAGEFQVLPNVTNRGAQNTFSTVGDVFSFIAAVDGQNLLTVTSSMPMPQAGDPGTGAYVVTRPLSETVGNTVTVPLTTVVAPGNRAVQVGDVLFSSVTRGVLASVQSISITGTPSVTIVTRQVYGKEALKALLDTSLHIVPVGGAPSLETIDFAWSCPKSQVPLPAGYEYRVGDMLFSHSAISGYAATKKLLISIVESTTSTALNVRTKVVFPMFLNASDIETLVADMVPKTRKVNGKALSADVALTEDDIAAGAANAKFSAAQNTKLNALPDLAGLNALLANKAALSHTHSILGVSGLAEALDSKVESSSVDLIWTGTQAEYDAIPTKGARTLYMIRG